MELKEIVLQRNSKDTMLEQCYSQDRYYDFLKTVFWLRCPISNFTYSVPFTNPNKYERLWNTLHWGVCLASFCYSSTTGQNHSFLWWWLASNFGFYMMADGSYGILTFIYVLSNILIYFKAFQIFVSLIFVSIFVLLVFTVVWIN